MKLQIAKIVGISNQKSWSQVHTFIPEEKEKIEKRGQLLAVISLTSLPFGTEIISAGKELIARLHEEYYGELEEKPFLRLKSSVEKVFNEASKEAKIEIVAGAVVDNVLYLAVAGGGKVVLMREGKLGEIIGESLDTVETASGFLEEGDVFLLGTKRFFELFSGEILKTALGSGSAIAAVEILTPLVLEKEEGLAAALVVNTQEVGVLETQEKINQEILEKKERKTNFLREFFLKIKRKITQPPISRPKKSFFSVALILFLILGVSMVFGAKERKRQAQQKKIATVLEQVKTKKEEGEAILTLNPNKAREAFKEAERLLKEIEGEKTLPPQLEQIKEELKVSLDSVLKEYEVEVKLFFDLELIKKGATGKEISFSSGQLIILDKENLAVYRVGANDKNSSILVGGKEIEGARKIAAFWPKVFVLVNEGIFQIDGETKRKNLIIKADGEWQRIIDFQNFGSNLYLIEPRMIWVYPVIEGSFGGKRPWLKAPTDFSNSLEMEINGAIWILTKEGKIEKYLRGIKEPFGISGMDKEFLEPPAFYTSPEEEHLYVLDKGNSRIVVLNKTGEYYAQYKNSQIENVLDFVVWEKGGKAFLLEGSKIYQLDLR